MEALQKMSCFKLEVTKPDNCGMYVTSLFGHIEGSGFKYVVYSPLLGNNFLVDQSFSDGLTPVCVCIIELHIVR